MARKCHSLHKAARGAALVTQAPCCAESAPGRAGGHDGPAAGPKPMTSGAQGCFVGHRPSLPTRGCFFLPA